jgi:hypothetical protein
LKIREYTIKKLKKEDNFFFDKKLIKALIEILLQTKDKEIYVNRNVK